MKQQEDKPQTPLSFWIKVVIAVLTGIASALGMNAAIHAMA